MELESLPIAAQVAKVGQGKERDRQTRVLELQSCDDLVTWGPSL
jgi:hypothetical protein